MTNPMTARESPDLETCYIAFTKCGCLVGASIATGPNAKYAKKDALEWMNDGLTVKLVTMKEFDAEYRCQLTGCKHKPKQEELGL